MLVSTLLEMANLAASSYPTMGSVTWRTTCTPWAITMYVVYHLFNMHNVSREGGLSMCAFYQLDSLLLIVSISYWQKVFPLFDSVIVCSLISIWFVFFFYLYSWIVWQDYPSIAHLVQKLSDNNIQTIFAVTEEFQPVYKVNFCL